jgi:vacuolar-type H+-ATPase subunit H
VVAEAIQRVKDAEREAEDVERAARAEGKKLVAEAHESTERLLDEMRSAAWEEEKTLKASAAKEAEAEAARLLKKSKAGVESVRSGAEARVAAGVKKVLEVITA